ncbi:MAG: methylmalonyl-CoA mutase [Deltaproteobacteria bacterium]|nr:methylmalonyl-CoA mutase [Deltaproteobacteria bacterium]
MANEAGDRGERAGEFPYTRGIHAEMYQKRLWTMRQYAGFGTAEETNERFRYLLSAGQTGLSVAFDLPTQMGLDSDDPRAEGEVGRTGVAIATIDDMERLFAEIPLDKVSTSMTINATAAILLALYIVVAERRGISPRVLSGTIQNDVLKEYIARGTYIFPPAPSMRIICDIFAYTAREVPKWNSISVSGYHIREAGSTAIEEVGFTLANGIAYLEAAKARGLAVDEVAPRVSFFFACHSDFLEEVAKFRAARRLWASIVRDRLGGRDPKSWMLRFHTQTGGCTLTAQQPQNNVVRVAVQALAAVLGGTQSLHTNSFDEALALPSADAARLALRTQQVIAHESGVTRFVDPLGGSEVIERLTTEIERAAASLIARVDEAGGAVRAIEEGLVQREIQESAYRFQRAVESGDRKIVGVNAFSDDASLNVPLLRVDASLERAQVERLRSFRANRNQVATDAALARLCTVARSSENLIPAIVDAVRENATLGEISGALRDVFGGHREVVVL